LDGSAWREAGPHHPGDGPAPPARVSVIMAAYNAEQWIAEALASVARQTFTDYEVFVVDDGSTDGTAEVVHRLGGPVRYLSQPHRGPASARNQGIAHSWGELIAFLDADDLWLEELLATVVPYFDDPATALVTGDNYRWDQRRPVEESPRKWQRKAHPSDQEDLWSRLLRMNVISPSTTVVRRVVLEAVGPFDETLTHASDYDLWLRVSRAGHRARFLDQPLGVIRLHSANISHDWGPKCDSHLGQIAGPARSHPGESGTRSGEPAHHEAESWPGCGGLCAGRSDGNGPALLPTGLLLSTP